MLAAKLRRGSRCVGALAVRPRVAAAGPPIAAPDFDGDVVAVPGLLGQEAGLRRHRDDQGVALRRGVPDSAPAIVLYFVLPIAWSALG